MKNLKYITWETKDGIPAFVVFPAHLQHCDMAPRDTRGKHVKAVGAGFTYQTVTGFHPHGHSESLNIGVHPSDFQTLNT